MPSPAYTDTYTVAIEGFTDLERTALASVFRLAARRSPAYRQLEDTGVSDFLIADADHAGALAAVQRGQRSGDTVFIGSRAPAGASAWLTRPIDPKHVLRELDALVELRLALPDPPSEMMPLGDVEIDEDEPRASAVPVRPPAALPAAPRGGAGREVLVVEDSAIARQFLKRRLERLGYRVHECASGEAAMELLSRRSFEIAFLDITLGPPGRIDGLQLCQLLKQRGAHGGGLRCAVIIVTGLTGSTDRVRGSLAGCDAYLTKPLHEAEFISTLLQVDPAFEWAGDASAAV